MVCDFRLLGKEKFRVQLTNSEDKQKYMGNFSAPAASLTATVIFPKQKIMSASLQLTSKTSSSKLK